MRSIRNASVGALFACALFVASLGVPGGTHTAGAAALSSVTDVSSGVYAACALISGGTVQCWGRNVVGQLGDGTTTDRSLPVTVKNSAGTGNLTGVTQVSAGGGVTCALLSDTTVRCWGNNFHGELGIGTQSGPQTCGSSACSTLPVAVKDPSGSGSLTGVTRISVGDGYACALLTDATAACWGNATFQSAAGRPPGADPTLPSAVVVNGTSTPLTGITDVSAGRDHSCAVINDGTARCWGHNFFGELGSGGTSGTYATVMNSSGSAPLAGVVQIAAGYQQTCATLSDQTARCWGNNARGQLGDGTMNVKHLPVSVRSDTSGTALTGVAAVVAGVLHSCARLTDGTARCWGDDGFSELGAGRTVLNGACGSSPCSPQATLVRTASGDPLAGIAQITASAGTNTCARLSGGTVRCWGENTYNEIGDATAINRCVPAEVGTVGPPAVAPDAPRNVSATKGVDRAIVHWAKQPGDCGTPVEKFTMTVSPGGGHIDVSSILNNAYQTSGEFSDLTPGHAYTFTVTATNAVGTSPASASTNAVVPLGEPSAPPAVTAAPNSGGATVSWKKPALTNGSAITSYAVSWFKNNVIVNQKFFNSTATHQTIGGLTVKTKYTFAVAAVNGYGTSPNSAPSAAIIIGAPRAPTGVSAVVKKTTPRAIVVSYTAGPNNGAPITKFVATCTSTNGGAAKLATVNGSTPKPIKVAGVTAGKKYTCRVAATNNRGTGPRSAPSKAVVT